MHARTHKERTEREQRESRDSSLFPSEGFFFYNQRERLKKRTRFHRHKSFPVPLKNKEEEEFIQEEESSEEEVKEQSFALLSRALNR